MSAMPGNIHLYFYVPKDYEEQRREAGVPAPIQEDSHGHIKHGKAHSSSHSHHHHVSSLLDGSHSLRRRSVTTPRWGGYPVVINFHGGGFTLGTATDDARWCGTVVDECNAVVVSVDYRLAPEHPFPTAVEDGADAVLWVHQHAEELGIDKEKIALSGFSSGGNMSFTVPLRLYDHQTNFARGEHMASESENDEDSISHAVGVEELPSSSTANLIGSDTSPQGSTAKTATTHLSEMSVPDIKIRCIVPWYPSLDYTRTRAERRATCVRADQELPALFTDLFDDSYLHPPRSVSLDSPYLSPGVAPSALLRAALPDDIIMHTCEWDMLLDEGQAFRDRLTEPSIGKRVNYTLVPGVPHGWDKAPNPFKPTPGVREHYLHACRELRRIMGETGLRERRTNEGWSAAPRGSVQIVR